LWSVWLRWVELLGIAPLWRKGLQGLGGHWRLEIRGLRIYQLSAGRTAAILCRGLLGRHATRPARHGKIRCCNCRGECNDQFFCRLIPLIATLGGHFSDHLDNRIGNVGFYQSLYWQRVLHMLDGNRQWAIGGERHTTSQAMKEHDAQRV